MPAIDLHSHSRHSDGDLSPAALVARARARGVAVLALTDHDSVLGVAEAVAAGREQGVELVPAVELSTIWRQCTVHVVGLRIDITDPALGEALARQAGARGRRACQIGERLERIGIPGGYAAALALAGNPDSISRNHYAQWLLAQGRVGSLQQAFDRYLGSGKPADVPLPWMPMAEAVAAIRGAGGHAVLAHPGRYSLTRTKLRELLKEFKAAGGEGMEVATATEKPDIVRYLGQLSQQTGLLASQGSDYHGSHMPWIDLGRFPELPPECTPVWTLWRGAA